jgi:hypothetical protein
MWNIYQNNHSSSSYFIRPNIVTGCSLLYFVSCIIQLPILTAIGVLLGTTAPSCKQLHPTTFRLSVIYLILSAVVLLFYILSVTIYNLWSTLSRNESINKINRFNPKGTSTESLLSRENN